VCPRISPLRQIGASRPLIPIDHPGELHPYANRTLALVGNSLPLAFESRWALPRAPFLPPQSIPRLARQDLEGLRGRGVDVGRYRGLAGERPVDVLEGESPAARLSGQSEESDPLALLGILEPDLVQRCAQGSFL
jgi:hypothetical protein